MAAKIIVAGKEYDMPESYTYRELGIIKRMSGVRAGELSASLKAGDAEALVAIAFIAMRRAGETVTEDFLLDQDMDAVDVKKVVEPKDGTDPPAAAVPSDG